MRDPKRIRTIIPLIENYWQSNPDLRFGQMLINLGIAPNELMLWNLDDDDLESGLKSIK